VSAPAQQLLETMPFAALIGIEISEARPELMRGQLDYAPARCTAGGLMHGGALMALADTCGAVCAFLNLPEAAREPERSIPRPTSPAQCGQEPSPRPAARCTSDAPQP
jgi:acyl-coenzyme A thioesterase PaaI-like protein